ncbi:(2,3-dihydroxybenzoyl)adenylate synthase [Streptomyces sp. TS71-3]|uniref:(2,3-dihydroxybenzoyl)adenylate synthase n=1 Tax=Streptomyces sp. TS71-3 TaxID=2733862 RepID=UPI001B026755|nr:AMP-binding protein [Streptomyces sp. TS71-3]GHJ35186.1 2,3-dihydroxybenzoate-AMP ligase [Streptomyces sp. TS71-3]
MADDPADGSALDGGQPDWPGWPEEAAERYRSAGYWAGRTFGAYLESWARARPDRPALVDGEQTWTYAELHTAAIERACGLHALGVAEGDRVVLHLPNSAEFALQWFALQLLGAVPVHAMPAHRSAEVRDLLGSSGASAYLIPDRHQRFDYRPMAAELLRSEPCLRQVVVHGDTGGHPGFTAAGDLASHGTSLPRRGASDPSGLAALLLSGGTTGRPKLIPRTHDDYAYNARAAAAASGLTERSVYLAVLPMGFNFALACPGVLGTLMTGGTVVVAPDPSPQTAFALIERRGVTITAISPALVPYWLDEHAHAPDALSGLQVLQVGGARLPDASARRLGRELRVTVQQVFGMAEGLICVTRLDDPQQLICTTQGRPLSPADEIRIVDDLGRDVPDGEPGELLTRGPYTLRGYYRAPEHNARSFTPDGFYVTGDIVRRLPSGHLVVTGRSKDQINRGGEKIAAGEVEEHLLAHPDIKAAALVAAPDERWGERSVAYLVCTQPPPTPRALADFLRGRGLAAHKAPDEVVAVDALPLTPVGKVDKQALRAGVGA